MHGKTSVIRHDGRGLYAGLPGRFSVIRYHSLVIDPETLPAGLAVSASTDDGIIMGVRHRELATTAASLEGVQFHPESILSEHGLALLRNFLRPTP
jgi:anthranilate synthase component II